jgi:HAMP domain-containing protein
MIGPLWRVNVRTRLTFWYITVLALILFVYSAAVYVLLRNYLFSEIDRKLREDIELTEEVLSENPDNPHALEDTKIRDRWLLEVWSKKKGAKESHKEKKIFASPSLESSPLGIVGAECLGKRNPPTTKKLPDGLHIRIACRTSRIDGVIYTIRAARSADRVHEELEQVLLMLALGLPAALLLSAFGGYMLARRALLPVSRMTEQAQSMSAERLGARLVIENPNDELGKLGTTFNQTFERLERSFEQMRRFSADASHELRTPLTAIRTMGEVALRKGHLPEKT